MAWQVAKALFESFLYDGYKKIEVATGKILL
jgi:hypothetical protein